ncbi:MAG: hypothetical protein HY703_12440 [Gemmatimonadetes bacterium]|nr:hypothetical protein [Gemmatimonadota bacterium]
MRNGLVLTLACACIALTGDAARAQRAAPNSEVWVVDQSDTKGKNYGSGRLAAVMRLSNVDDQGVEKADAHAVRVRRR